MHTLLALTSLSLVLLGSTLILRMLKPIQSWSQRRLIQLTVLLLPLVNASQGIDGLHHFLGNLCLLVAPLWDYPLGILLPMAMGLLVLVSLGNGVVRWSLLSIVVTRKSIPASPETQALVDTLARAIAAPRTRLRLCPFQQPLAFTCGMFRPTIVLSAWMFEHLDQQEREAVLAHELEHVVRHDYLVGWIATMLRDAFFYLPMSRSAYQHFQEEKELACDDLAVKLTRKPLALASALTKVWLSTGKGPLLPCVHTAPSLAGNSPPMLHRIKRLLTTSQTEDVLEQRLEASVRRLGWKCFALIVLVGGNILVNVALLGCTPLTYPLGRFFF